MYKDHYMFNLSKSFPCSVWHVFSDSLAANYCLQKLIILTFSAKIKHKMKSSKCSSKLYAIVPAKKCILIQPG